MHGGSVTVQQTSKGMVVVTVYHPDGEFLGASLSFNEVRQLLEAINHELNKKFNKFNPRTKRPRGRTAEKHTWNNKALTIDQWCLEIGITRSSFHYHLARHGSVAKALDHLSKRNGKVT